MRKLVEDANEGMESLLGETVTIFCANYFYTGKLSGVNDDCIKIDEPEIVYDTGSWSKKAYENTERMVALDSLYIQKNAIEAFARHD
jgi:hypothetical protein